MTPDAEPVAKCDIAAHLWGGPRRLFATPANETELMQNIFETGGPAGQPAATGLIKDATTESFMADVVDASNQVPVLVDFWAPWCGPCRQLTPVLENIVRGLNGKVRLVKMNIDEHPEVAGQLGVQSIPAVFAFREGRPVDGFMGALPESQVKSFIARILGDGGADEAATEAADLALADAALAQGDARSAAEIFALALQADPADPRAIGGLARCYIKMGDLERAEQTLQLVPREKAADPAIVSAHAGLDLARKAQAAGDPAELRAKADADPSDLQARYDLALALAAHDDRQKAADALLDILKADRNWNEDAARKQLVELFAAWGPKDPATVKGRQRLSALLFS